jgi:hypothetical protein
MTESTTKRRFGALAITIAAVAGLAVGAGVGFGVGAFTAPSTESERLASAVRGCTAEPGSAADVANFATITDANHLEYVADGEVEGGEGNAHYANMSCLLSSVGVGALDVPAILQGPYDLNFETDLATATVTGDDFDSATLTIELH